LIGITIDNVAAEVYTSNMITLGNQDSTLSTMINNALLGNVDSTPSDTPSIYHVQEQFITIKPDGYNDNIIFEEPKKKVDVLNSNVPFLLPVPFP
jgi:hypothetical protein